MASFLIHDFLRASAKIIWSVLVVSAPPLSDSMRSSFPDFSSLSLSISFFKFSENMVSLSFSPFHHLMCMVRFSRSKSQTCKLITSLTRSPEPYAREIIHLCFSFLIVSIIKRISFFVSTIGSFFDSRESVISKSRCIFITSCRKNLIASL